ncbi:hypothetical protein D4764_0186430 [Takifugu flavidus]|uniref:Uncharacterized protein n=1 Tax=Takifugu flavidus TaxID=433684 RepID=A0A5C6MK44_9TELE|nr:hypothetical protein D4764_0186430 [Takifugu flavidus]
MLLTATHL